MVFGEIFSFLTLGAVVVGIRHFTLEYYKETVIFEKDNLLHSHLLDILRKCSAIKTYKPPFFLPLGVLQSMYNDKMVRSKTFVPKEYLRQTIHIPSFSTDTSLCCPKHVPAGLVSIDWLNKDSSEITVFIVPGLTGSSKEPYVLLLANELANLGYSVACFNPRSRGGNELVSPFLYSAGYTEDLRFVLNRDEFKLRKIFCVGFSLGANYLTKFLGEEGKKEGDEVQICGAIMLGGPVDLFENARHLRSTFINRVCDDVLAGYCRELLQEFRHVFEKSEVLNLEACFKAKMMREFDNEFTAKLFEFASAEEYYKVSGAVHFLETIKTDCLFINSKNDPIIDYIHENIPGFQKNPHLIRLLTNSGGHSLTWPTGFFGDKSWMVSVVAEFIREKVRIEKQLDFEEIVLI